jgi:hypothetical protein
MTGLIAAFLVGLAVGLLLAPVLRSWLLWRQYRDASREAARAERTVRYLETREAPADHTAAAAR